MALNPFFQQGSSGEKSLVQSLINEQLKMYGVDVHYMPRKYLTEKSILKEVVQSKFDDAYPLEAYIDNFDVAIHVNPPAGADDIATLGANVNPLPLFVRNIC